MRKKIVLTLICISLATTTAAEVVDDFERGNIDPYTFDGSGDSSYISISSSEVYSGDYSLEVEPAGTSGNGIYSETGLNYYPQEGDSVRWKTYFDSLNSGVFGARYRVRMGDPDSIEVRYDRRDQELRLTGESTSDESVNWDNYLNQWLTTEVDWGEDEVNARVYDENNNLIADVTEQSPGSNNNQYLHFRITSSVAGDSTAYFDDITAQPQLDLFNPGPEGTISSNSPELEIDVTHPEDQEVVVEFFDGEIGENPPIGSDIVDGSGTASTEWEGLQNDETYEWSIRACDEDNNCVDDGVWSLDIESAEWDLDISGPTDATRGFSEQYSAEVTNTGSTTGAPGLIRLTKDGSLEDTEQVGELEPGDDYELSNFITFNAEGSKEICADIEHGEEECMTVEVEESDDNIYEWRSLVNFRLDLTGPDSGLGWDMDSTWHPGLDDYSSLQIDFEDNRQVVYTDIYWQDTYEIVDDGQDLSEGDLLDVHEPPMCGDDEEEYLLEEMGQSINSEQFEGRYACADNNNYCVYRQSSGPKIFDREDKINTDQEGEQRGRLKNNEAICAQRPGLENIDQDNHNLERPHDLTPQWYSQDYANEIEGSAVIDVPDQNLCRENTLFDSDAKRWIDYDYINDHPLAVTGGIDDSWNPRMDQMSHPYYISDPSGENWDLDGNQGPLEQGYSPVPTGTSDLYEGHDSNYEDKSVVADPTNMQYGFCAGDDASEYYITQSSQTRFVDDEDDIIGVAEAPDSCVLDNSEYDVVEDSLEHENFSPEELQDQRMLYQEGDTIEIESEGTQREIGCFGNEWWDDWPIHFLEDDMNVALTDTDRTTFRVINPRATERTFDLTLSTGNDELETMSSFEETGTDEMTVTVPGESSNLYEVEVVGIEEIDDKELQVRAESTAGDLDGTDTIDISVIEGYVSDTEGEVRDVPGITIIQIAALFLLGLMYFVYRE